MGDLTDRTARSGLLRRLARREDGAVSTWFAMLLVPMLGFTFGAIRYAQLAEYRTGMLDAMDAAGLGLARQLDLRNLDDCVIASADPDDPNDVNGPIRAELERYAREFFEENYPEYGQLYADKDLSRPLDLNRDMTFEITCAYISVATTAYVDMGGVLGGYFGVGAIPLQLETEISLPGAGRVEIALVLDVTGSMCFKDEYIAPDPSTSPSCASSGEQRLDKLRDAVSEMLDDPNFYGSNSGVSNPFVRIGIVPFASTVNVGATYSGSAIKGPATDQVSDWMDGWGFSTPGAKWHGENFINAKQDGTISGQTPNGDWISTPNTLITAEKVNHFTLFNSIGDDAAVWKGCVEARAFPLDETTGTIGENMNAADYNAIFSVPSSVAGDVAAAGNSSLLRKAWDGFDNTRKPENNSTSTKPGPYTGSASANTKFVPYFNPDQPDCYASACDWTWDTFGIGRDHPVRAFMAYSPGEQNLSNDQQFPGYFFDDVEVPTSGSEYMVYDAYYTRPVTSTMDSFHRYRNVVLAARAAKNCHNGSYSNANNSVLLAYANKHGFANCFSDEYRLRQAYVGALNNDIASPKYEGKYDHAGGSYDSGANAPGSFDVPTSGPNNGCPGPLLPLTTQKDELTAHVDNLVAAGGTNTAMGLAWGWRLVDHRAPFVQASNPADPGGGRWKKYVVLMTDGENTLTYTNRNDVNSYNRSYYNAYGFAAQDRLDVDTSGGVDPAAAMEAEVNLKTIRMCHRMREQGIKVYTIGFAIKDGGSAEQMLEACALEEDSYFDADDGDELIDAFKKITAQIVELHVSG